MWKKLLYLTFIIWMSKPIQSAVLECSWDPEMLYCTPLSITPVTQPNEIITINGLKSDYVNPTTTYIKFFQQVIIYIPTGLFTLFPNLKSLIVEQSETTTFITDSIPNCGVLDVFSLKGGTFTNIPAGVLQSCTSLTNFGIGENNVTTIDVDAFRGLTNLEAVSISGTKISCLPPELFQYAPNLLSVGLSNNMITTIDSNLFAQKSFLRKINLSINLIAYVPVFNLAASTDQYLSIDLSVNPIYAIAPDFCSIFLTRPADLLSIAFSKTLCILDNTPSTIITSSVCQNPTTGIQNCFSNWTLSMNGPVPCAVLPPLTTTTLPSTTTVSPSTEIVTTSSPTPASCPSDKICRYFLDQYNRYTCILDGVDSVLTSISGNHLITFSDEHVRRVVFTNSFLSRIPPILFQKFTSLEYLTVSNCSISVINTNTFTECGNLKYFDASENFITTVDEASFKICAALEVIDLSGNKVNFISGQLFVNNPTLKTVYINKPPVIVLV